MSRIGNAPITIANGVTVEITNGGKFDHQLVAVTGPKGSLTLDIRPEVSVTQADTELKLTRINEEKQTKSYHGLYRSLLNNMVQGVSTGFSQELEIIGIGYRAELQGEKLVLSLGYSHKIDFVPPAGIVIETPSQTEIVVSGADKQVVGEVAAKIRAFRAPEPYKGKGVRYKDEQVRRKSVKQA